MFNRKESIFSVAVLVLSILGMYYLGPAMTGFVVQEKTFANEPNIVAASNGTYTFETDEAGELKSMAVDGKISAGKKARIYLDANGTRYLVFDSERLDENEDEESSDASNLITDNRTITASDGADTASKDTRLELIIEEQEETLENDTISPINDSIDKEEIEKKILLDLSYMNGTVYDENDDGLEPVYGVVDLSVKGTSFNWEAGESKLCTRWQVHNLDEKHSTEFCNGNDECCSFIDLKPKSPSWSEDYYSTYGKDGSGEENIIFAQVIYYDVNLSAKNPESEISYSQIKNLSVNFYDNEIEFFDMCLDTCKLEGLNITSYKLVFEMEENTTLWLDSIKYTILAGSGNQHPVLLKNISKLNVRGNEPYKLQLGDYFNDPDGDKLAYDYFKSEDIEIEFRDNAAIITPNSAFEGLVFTFIIANDTENIAISDVFAINVSAPEALPPENISLNKTSQKIKVGDEDIVITSYVFSDSQKIGIKSKSAFNDGRSFGYAYDDTIINDSLKSAGKNWDNKIFWEIGGLDSYEILDSYRLSRPMAYEVTNTIGQKELRNGTRILSIEDIFKKDKNLYDYKLNEFNITEKISRDFNFSITKNKGNFTIMFYNLFDLYPTFTDNFDNEFSQGTLFQTNISSSANGFANVTLNYTTHVLNGDSGSGNMSSGQRMYNLTGNFTSQIFDTTSTTSVFDKIVWNIKLPNVTESTNITFQTRVGNLSPITNPWSDLYIYPNGTDDINVNNNVGRYIQYKAVFTTPDKYITPILENVGINYSIINTCSCPASGDWVGLFSDNCYISTDCDMKGNSVYLTGAGTWTLNARIYNFNRIAAHEGTIACIREAGCLG